jgi:hypothetical protein
MSKMKDLYTDIQEMLVSGFSVDEIMEKTGAPLAWILEVKYSMDSYIMENDYYDDSELCS